jgi:hypothetical protein
MATSTSPTRGRKFLLLLLVWVFFGGLFFIVAEVFVRLKGFKPFTVAQITVTVDPGGRFFTNHPALGYRQLAGEFNVTLVSNYTFHVTHGADSLRITHPPRPAGTPKRPEIWVMGCSYTHGWSLNDEDSYPWQLQALLPGYEVANFGVNGYGTLHSMIQFKEALKEQRPKPAVVVAAYAAFHDERNTFIRSRRKAVVPYNQLGLLQQPYARLGADGQVQYFLAPVEYAEFPLMRHSAFIHFFEEKYNLIEERRVRSQAVTRAIVKEFAELCRTNGVQFVVAGITRDATPLLDYCREQKIPCVDMAVKLSEEGMRNLPYDDHPSARANKEFAAKLGAFLTNPVLPQLGK